MDRIDKKPRELTSVKPSQDKGSIIMLSNMNWFCKIWEFAIKWMINLM